MHLRSGEETPIVISRRSRCSTRSRSEPLGEKEALLIITEICSHLIIEKKKKTCQ